jgi:DNA-binding NarL/FixJ family response regulator
MSEDLTAPEMKLLALTAQGWTNPALAQALAVPEQTVDNGVRRALTRLGLPPSSRIDRRVTAVLALTRHLERGLARGPSGGLSREL